MDMDSVEPPKMRKFMMRELRLKYISVQELLVGTVAIAGVVAGTSYAIDKYQPITHLAAHVSGRSIEEHKKENIKYGVEQFFERYDLNKDGVVDGKEYLKKFDLDGNGSVDRNEYQIVTSDSYWQ